MKIIPSIFLAGSALYVALSVHAQTPKPNTAPLEDAHQKETVAQHRAMAKAHEDAAKCLEAGTEEKQCHAQLQQACKGLAIGKYCGMRHTH
jgi:hypothetical protein